MSIAEIEKNILEEAQAEAAKIKAETDEHLQQLESIYLQKKEAVRKTISTSAQRKAEEIKRSYLIPARLEDKRLRLETKQTILLQLYAEIGKENNLSPLELSQLREATEVSAAQILFG